MIAAGEGDSNSNKLTNLDLARLDSLAIGDFFEGEMGNFKILKYRYDYVLILYNSHTSNSFQEFANKENLIRFLNDYK